MSGFCRLTSMAVILTAIACAPQSTSLPRGKASASLDTAWKDCIALFENGLSQPQQLHSMMIVKDGNVVKEGWFNGEGPDIPHVLFSVSKSFTATAVGYAISEGKLSLDDAVIGFFPTLLPDNVSEHLSKMKVRHLLTMTCGHSSDPTGQIISKDILMNRMEKTLDVDLRQAFLAFPVEHEPGTVFCYNSLGTYMLSAIVQEAVGEPVLDYLYPRLFEPLGIERPAWDMSKEGVNLGGWGLYLKTEDMAKFGLLLLQKGKWNGKQVLPEEWVTEASSMQVECQPADVTPEQLDAWLEHFHLSREACDWTQGYGFQLWRSRHGFRADGMFGQFILVLPEKNAVIAMTANIWETQPELNFVWETIYPAL